MSPLWHESAYVGLAPQRIHIRSRPALLRRAKGGGETEDVAAVAGAEPWVACVEHLERALQRRRTNDMRLDVVLSSHFVRFQLVPWQTDLGERDERVAYAGFLFKEVYGDMSSEWEIRLSEEPPGRSSVACAIDRALLEALRRVSAASGCSLRSVRPYLVEEFNRVRRGLRGDNVIFALSEPGRLCAGHLRKGAWRSLRNEAVAGAAGAALSAVLGQLAVTGEEPTGGADVYWLDGSGPAFSSFATPKLRRSNMDGLAERGFAWEST